LFRVILTSGWTQGGSTAATIVPPTTRLRQAIAVVQPATRIAHLAIPVGATTPTPGRLDLQKDRHGCCLSDPAREDFAVQSMNLAVWLPALFALGLAVFGLMFAFVAACERV